MYPAPGSVCVSVALRNKYHSLCINFKMPYGTEQRVSQYWHANDAQCGAMISVPSKVLSGSGSRPFLTARVYVRTCGSARS
jgi:hypothetical protein